jgi:heterodisulfide reductase subunit A-like polyferredoxin
MYTLKHVVQLKEKYKEDVEVYVFYMDIRSPVRVMRNSTTAHASEASILSVAESAE